MELVLNDEWDDLAFDEVPRAFEAREGTDVHLKKRRYLFNSASVKNLLLHNNSDSSRKLDSSSLVPIYP